MRMLPAVCVLRPTRRFIGKAEPALVVTLYFHLSTFLLSLGPMAAGWPSPGVLLTWRELLLVLGITVTSFSSQLCLTRGFQLQSASRAAGLNFSQVAALACGVAACGSVAGAQVHVDAAAARGRCGCEPAR